MTRGHGVVHLPLSTCPHAPSKAPPSPAPRAVLWHGHTWARGCASPLVNTPPCPHAPSKAPPSPAPRAVLFLWSGALRARRSVIGQGGQNPKGDRKPERLLRLLINTPSNHPVSRLPLSHASLPLGRDDRPGHPRARGPHAPTFCASAPVISGWVGRGSPSPPPATMPLPYTQYSILYTLVSL